MSFLHIFIACLKNHYNTSEPKINQLNYSDNLINQWESRTNDKFFSKVMVPSYCFRPFSGFCGKFLKKEGLLWTKYSLPIFSFLLHFILWQFLFICCIFIMKFTWFCEFAMNVTVVYSKIASELLKEASVLSKFSIGSQNLFPNSHLTALRHRSSYYICNLRVLSCRFASHGIFWVQEHEIYSEMREYYTFNWVNICIEL